MIKNYLKIAFRSLWRQRIFSFINIMGLAVSLTACFLVFLYVRFELNNHSLSSSADRILVATGILAILIALYTISFWIIRQALANHLKSGQTK
jgi:hypothetical protein